MATDKLGGIKAHGSNWCNSRVDFARTSSAMGEVEAGGGSGSKGSQERERGRKREAENHEGNHWVMVLFRQEVRVGLILGLSVVIHLGGWD